MLYTGQGEKPGFKSICMYTKWVIFIKWQVSYINMSYQYFRNTSDVPFVCFYVGWTSIHFDNIYALKNVRFFANLTILESMKNSDLLHEAQDRSFGLSQKKKSYNFVEN